MKFVKILAFILLAILIIIGIALAYINFSPLPSYQPNPPEMKVDIDSARIAEGARMASMMCNQCHRSSDNRLGGALMADAKAFGEIYAPNITQHPELGIKEYSDGELAYLLRTGIKRDGSYSPPYMPKFPHLSDEDLENIIGFLRSDYPLVQPSENSTPESRPSFLTKFLCKVAFKPLPYPDKPIPPPNTNNTVEWGKYLATAKFECFSCHSKSFETVDVMVPENSEGFFGGGNQLFDLQGNVVLSPNLTMDEKTGLGKWRKQDFIQAVKTGKKPDGTMFSYPMAPFTALTDAEVSAIWAYLKSLPEIYNEEG